MPSAPGGGQPAWIWVSVGPLCASFSSPRSLYPRAIPLVSSPEFAATWAWRIPFFLALPLGIVGVYLRTRLEETPAFQTLLSESEEREGTQAGAGIKMLFVKYWPAMLTAGGIVVAWNITNYMLTSYMPTFLEDKEIDATTLRVVGFSFGGVQAADFTRSLTKVSRPTLGYKLAKPIPVRTLVTLDPVNTTSLKHTDGPVSNVQNYFNYYELNPGRTSIELLNRFSRQPVGSVALGDSLNPVGGPLSSSAQHTSHIEP